MIDAKEALDILVSYSIAQEGTNTLYLRLVDTLLKRKEEYNLIEIEMILNYFPHNIWKNEPSLNRLKENFYYQILQMIKENVEKVDNRQFLSIFQGLTLTDQ